MERNAKRLKKALEYQKGLYEVKVNEAFFYVIATRARFNADDVWEECLKREVPPKEIARLVGPMFRIYRRSGIVQKESGFAISKRAARRPLPWYSKGPKDVK